MGFNRSQRRKLQRELSKAKTVETIKERIKHDAADEIMDKVENTRVEILMNCFVMALHDEFGFGQKRCMKALNAVDSLMISFDSGEMDIDDYRRMADEKVNIKVCYEDCEVRP